MSEESLLRSHTCISTYTGGNPTTVLLQFREFIFGSFLFTPHSSDERLIEPFITIITVKCPKN